MQTHDISAPRWKSTFDSLTRVYEGSAVSLELLTPDLGAQYEIEDRPFRGIDFDATGIVLHFDTREGKHLTHIIAKPKQVQIEERDDGLIAAMAIESDSDPRAVLHFHAPQPSRLLEGDARAVRH